MKKILITTDCDPKEDWEAVLRITVPRFQRYAHRHGYDFKAVWYGDLRAGSWGEFSNPVQFTAGAANYDVRKDFILWKMDRSWLAPNWLRYAMTLQLIDEYDLIVYMDGDLVIADFEHDVAEGFPEDKFLATCICGPSSDNAGPGGPLYLTRAGYVAKDFWQRVWAGRKWLTHPNWTDGVDFMDLLGYSIMPPVHKIRETEYDSCFHRLPDNWIVWGRHPTASGRFYHVSDTSGDPAGKAQAIAQLIAERGI